ncbi:MAG: hypothetical protein SNH88_06275 [Rikenellaceae bacterium]
MINAAFDIIEFLKSNFSFLFSLGLYSVLAVLLAKSIKKNYKVYYWLFGVLSFGFIIPSLARLLGVTLPFNLSSIPILGLSAGELSSAANFIHPVLVIIMYMGALSAKIPAVGKLLSIRKELSIIVGFPVLAHVVKRLFGTFPGGWQYFFDHETYIQNPRVVSVLGSGITSFAFVLGLVMTILFLVLWITSFDSVHRKMGTKRWKSVQRWSYGLYAMLFLHSLALQVGGMVSDNAREVQRAKIEVAEGASHGARPSAEAQRGAPQQGVQQSHGAKPSQELQKGAPQPQQGVQQSHGHGRPKSFAFADLEISRSAKRWVNIVALFVIYGSYLYLRVRKARRRRA